MKNRVIITGASSGIGRALAHEFARGGYDLFLTARSEAGLRRVADECAAKYRVETEIFAADLADAAELERLASAIENTRFDALVNNAGFGVKGDFAETDLDDELKMLNVQLAALLKLTKAVLPPMIRAKSGNILNVASVYSFAPVPKQSVYAASKAFILNYSHALADELKAHNIKVSVLCPGITQTEFRTRAGIADKPDSGMSAQKVAEIGFAGMKRGRQTIVPGFANKVFVFLARHTPPHFFTSVVRFINNRRGVNQKPKD